MRVAFVVFGSIDQLSGGYRYDRELIAALTAAGHSVTVVSQPQRPYRRHASVAREGRWRGALIEAAPELIVIDELNHRACAGALGWMRRELGVPIVGLIHHLRRDESVWARVTTRREIAFLRGVDAWVTTSSDTLRRVRRLARRARPSAVAHPGVDRPPPQRSPTPRARDAGFLVAALGTITPRKNQIRLARAAARNRSVRVVIAGAPGDRRYTERLRALLRRRGLTERVTLVGHIDAREREALYRRADAVCQPSHFEGFGIAHADAIARGLPLIAGRRGGLRDILRHDHNAILVRTGSVGAIARALRRLVRQPETARRLAHNAAATRLADWNAAMAGAVRFFECLAGRRRA